MHSTYSPLPELVVSLLDFPGRQRNSELNLEGYQNEPGEWQVPDDAPAMPGGTCTLN